MKFKAIREMFAFTQKERYGVIALLCLIFILLAINISLPYLVKNKPVDTSAWEAQVKQYLNRAENQERQVINQDPETFDPNNISYDALSRMGVPARVASNWIKYLDKGGRFKEAKEVRKIYGMTEDLFDHLESSILIPDEVKVNKKITNTQNRIKSPSYQRNKVFSNEKSLAAIDSVELNLADSTELENLPGIGPVLASRIIRYRNLLGGFYSVNQLHEVYGLREEHYLAASPHLFVAGEQCRRFNINFATLEELGRHPYIGFRTARKIIRLRDEKGKYSSLKNLSEVMTADSIERLSPYLKLNQ